MKRKLSVILTLIAMSTGLANAQNNNIETKTLILKEQDHNTQVELTQETVRCSALGYGLAELKISVPALDYISFFNHSNIGEAQPCMTAGACRLDFPGQEPGEGLDPSDILDPNNPTEETVIHQLLVENYTLNHDTQTCTRSLKEEVTAEVRGLTFHHVRFGILGEYPFALCQQIQ